MQQTRALPASPELLQPSIKCLAAVLRGNRLATEQRPVTVYLLPVFRPKQLHSHSQGFSRRVLQPRRHPTGAGAPVAMPGCLSAETTAADGGCARARIISKHDTLIGACSVCEHSGIHCAASHSLPHSPHCLAALWQSLCYYAQQSTHK